MPVTLHLGRAPDKRAVRILSTVQRRLSFLDGAPVRVRFRPSLHAHRGRLVSTSGGQPVHAGTFLRQRLIVFDSALLARPRELSRIAVHELAHFIWVRSANALRDQFATLLASELDCGAKGELGWSAESRKANLHRNLPRNWRAYVCESFCDTAAWLYAGFRVHDEFTLASRYRLAREKWFVRTFSARVVLI